MAASMDVTKLSSYLGNYSDHFAILGALCFTYAAFSIGRKIVYITVLAVRRSFAVNLKKHGRWAVITGSTDGIGKCYALQLAQKGMDIVLISRNPQKLSNVAQEIGEHHKVQVKVITADFKKTDIYENIKQQLNGLDIGILVNNVGMVNAENPCYHCEAEDFEKSHMDIVNVNVLSCVMMTGIVLPGMLERKRGTIINISSAAGLRPMPFFTTYSASKAFVRFFTEALNMEYSSQGVTIQLVLPCLVQSSLGGPVSAAFGIVPGFAYPTADAYVRKAIQTIGRESITSAYWFHGLEQSVVSQLPDSRFHALVLDARNRRMKLLKKQ